MVLVQQQERRVATRSARPVGSRDKPPPRVPQRINGVRIRSVIRVAILAFGAVLVSIILAGIAVWWLAGSTGQLSAIEGFVADALGMQSFELPSSAILLGWIAFAAFASMIATIVVTLLALVYNRVADLVGGIEIETTPLRPVASQHGA